MLNKLVPKPFYKDNQDIVYFGTMLDKLVPKQSALICSVDINFGTMLDKLVPKPRFNMTLFNHYCLS